MDCSLWGPKSRTWLSDFHLFSSGPRNSSLPGISILPSLGPLFINTLGSLLISINVCVQIFGESNSYKNDDKYDDNHILLPHFFFPFPAQPSDIDSFFFFFPSRFTNLLNVGEFSSQLSFIFTQHTCWGKGVSSTLMILRTLSLNFRCLHPVAYWPAPAG